jgi:hypothetical protein
LTELAPTFSTLSGVCRADDCTNPAPVVAFGEVRIDTLCDSCQDDDDEPARIMQKLVDRAGIPRRLANWTLSSYVTDIPTGLAVEQARTWLEDYVASRGLPVEQAVANGLRRNLFVDGSIGSGKSTLAAAVAHELCHQAIPVRWIVLRDLLELKRESFDDTTHIDIDAYRRVPVLVLDDLGAERFTPWAVEQLEIIVSTRYDAWIPTICTSNFTATKLAAAVAGGTKTTADFDDGALVRARRIISRLTEGAQRIEFTGRDRRLGASAA